jgi:hypothetical protein
MNIHLLENKEQCRQAWERAWPVKSLFDMWPARECFHNAFNRHLSFRVMERKGKITGFLPLVWNDETGEYVIFPGETWHGKTWIEQNHLVASSPQTLNRMINSVTGPLHLRYLTGSPGQEAGGPSEIDEIGYLFYPGFFDFSFDNYWLSFSGKTRKKLKSDLNRLNLQNVRYYFNREKDISLLFDMNLNVFGENSYFCDPRFRTAFANLIRFLDRSGMLRITTVCVKDKIAAVDVGAIFNNTYTLLAGGTDPQFPGIAKMINLHHLNYACSSRFDCVDFLCGDFNWKERFHLTPRPLYKLVVNSHTQHLEYMDAACA